MSGNQTVISSDPHTIWALGKRDRPAAVVKLVRECARQFCAAVHRDDAGAAQDYAIHALASIAGLFPDPNEDAHALLTSIVGMLTDAKWGRTDHILMRGAAPIIGTMRGFGHAYVGGFAISAVEVLTGLNLLSVRKARIEVATLLAKAGYSLRKDGHGNVKPITQGAIRNWCENSDDYPLQNAFATEMASIHATNLNRKSATTLADVLVYLQSQTIAAIQHSRLF